MELRKAIGFLLCLSFSIACILWMASDYSKRPIFYTGVLAYAIAAFGLVFMFTFMLIRDTEMRAARNKGAWIKFAADNRLFFHEDAFNAPFEPSTSKLGGVQSKKAVYLSGRAHGFLVKVSCMRMMKNGLFEKSEDPAQGYLPTVEFDSGKGNLDFEMEKRPMIFAKKETPFEKSIPDGLRSGFEIISYSDERKMRNFLTLLFSDEDCVKLLKDKMFAKISCSRGVLSVASMPSLTLSPDWGFFSQIGWALKFGSKACKILKSG